MVARYVVDSDSSSLDLDSIKIVNGQTCTPLVLIEDKAESFRLPCLPVLHETNANSLPVLREYTEATSFSQFIRKASQEDPGTVLVLGVP